MKFVNFIFFVTLGTERVIRQLFRLYFSLKLQLIAWEILHQFLIWFLSSASKICVRREKNDRKKCEAQSGSKRALLIIITRASYYYLRFSILSNYSFCMRVISCDLGKKNQLSNYLFVFLV